MLTDTDYYNYRNCCLFFFPGGGASICEESVGSFMVNQLVVVNALVYMEVIMDSTYDFKIVLEYQTFRHFGNCGVLVEFDVKFKWLSESDTCIVSCYGAGADNPEEQDIICDPSDRGKILQVSWDYLYDCEMEDCLYSMESHSWIVEFEGELYAVFFDEAEKRGYVEYTINRLQEPSSKSDGDYSVKKGTEHLNIENREKLLYCVERLIDGYQNSSTQ